MIHSLKTLLVVLILIPAISPGFGQKYTMSSGFKLDPKHPAYLPDEVVVRFKDPVDVIVTRDERGMKTNLASFNRTFQEIHGVEMRKVFRKNTRESFENFRIRHMGTKEVTPLFNFYRIRVEGGKPVPEILSALREDPSIQSAEPNYVVYGIDFRPNDPIYQDGAQWHLDTIGGPAAWAITTSDTNQVLGILDTGIDLDHPDLAGNLWFNRDEVPGNGIDDDGNGFVDDFRGWNFIDDNNFPDDDNGHGSHVAGIAAAVTNNGTGVAGVAWYARLMAVKMLQSTGQGNSADFGESIMYAWENGASVVNMSVGSYGESSAVKAALEYAYSTATLVASAGNDFYNLDLAPMFPAAYSFVLGVESSDFYNDLAFFSNFDPDGPVISTPPGLYNYEVRAPGLAIYSTFGNGSYHALTGTSMSAPIVSGSAALLRSHFPGISNEKIFVRLIQGADKGVLNIHNSLTMTPVPDLQFVSYSILDTLPGCDRDGQVDAGETIQITISLRNCGSQANGVWSKLRFGTFEDTTVAVIRDSLSLIGSISEYATMNNNLSPFKVYIPAHVIHNRDIVFNILSGAEDSDTLQNRLVIKVYNAKELYGIMDSTLYLTPDKLWFINRSFKVGFNGNLHLLPGTTLELYKTPINHGKIYGHGKPDSLVLIRGFLGGGFLRFNYADFSLETGLMEGPEGSFQQVHDIYDLDAEPVGQPWSDSEQHSESKYAGELRFDHCTLNSYPDVEGTSYINCILNNSNVGRYADTIYRCNFNIVSYSKEMFANYYGYNNFSGNFSFFDREYVDTVRIGPNNIVTTTVPYFYRCPEQRINPQYWGTTDTAWIDAHIYDNEESNEYCPPAVFTPFLSAPTPLAHGMAWKIQINGYNPQEVNMDPIGAERVRFDVYFNRPMDTDFEPQLSFGVRSPYNQYIVTDSASWNADSTIWTAYFNVSLETGDGMNYLRVQNARDPEGFEMPVENNMRFGFIIRSAGSASIPFLGIPGIGRVTLQWAHASSADVLGYNLYRFTSTSDTLRLNAGFLLTDTTYVDYHVIPDTVYHYLYTIIGTDFKESDWSRMVLCTPLQAAEGDANGDGEVNVLDITTTVNYILNLSPLPFLFSAADMNHDKVINVLDLPGIINIILGKKKLTDEKSISNLKPTHIWLDNDGIRIRTEGNVTAIQFEIKGQNLHELSLSQIPEGFEVATSITRGKLIGIIYSPENLTLPKGMMNLAGFEVSPTTLAWGEVVAGSPQGEYIPVIKNCSNQGSTGVAGLNAFPNPFQGSVTITYRLSEAATINLSVYTTQGQILENIENKVKEAGTHFLIWNSKEMEAGIYFFRLTGITKGGETINKEVKVLYIK